MVLSPQAADALKQQSAAQQVDVRPNPNGLVFPSPAGSYWRDSNFNRRVWQPTREAAGLPELLFHTLRYFYVSHVRAQGLPTALSEQLTRARRRANASRLHAPNPRHRNTDPRRSNAAFTPAELREDGRAR